MMPYPFDCPRCDQRYWHEHSITYDETYDDTICRCCSDELWLERFRAEKEKAWNSKQST